ncbi:OsmC family protein [Deinococcus proteolyticus MRP]|uniref:OsmC family protein n=1 Tax=Deinococcus proteolyticus (strain ATCC 35074 / DSM 20540 / JCM 6276 / NBRC 101906 / NCIMB 13154 / VKM Ac-1939 / CCM 2703 / MRP) TaxID=693977 RepID=F0RLF3_DEIPM|nr:MULTISPECIES: OsmC family protein [Deinococcus]ADY25857.1 OsmC family protein [Deinococcus proteolyticus MRP]MCY1701978.1 OsmC family protein [Deinococcus sp. SL84]
MANTKTVNIDWLGEQRYVGRSENGQQLLIDNSANKVGVSPMDALLAALGTCTAYDVVGIMEKRKTPLSSYRIEVEGERADTTPARYTRITVRHIAGGEGVTKEQLEKAAHLSHEKYCSVAASLNAEIVLDVRLAEGSEG